MLNGANPNSLSYIKKFVSFEKMDGILQRLPKIYRRESRERLIDETRIRRERLEKIILEGDILSYASEEKDQYGLYISGEPLSPERNYFEIEILESGATSCGVSLGLVSTRHPLDEPPGWVPESVGVHVDNGKLYKGSPRGSYQIVKPQCGSGDRLGCGVKFEELLSWENQQTPVPVFFTRNGKELGCVSFPWPIGGLFPSVSLHSLGEEVQLKRDVKWIVNEDISMCIDSNEDDWSRLHDIRLNGSILEYSGQGKSIVDVGLAQARYPLNTTNHYYEIEILDPGMNCYIAIGLARKDYPKCRHPGWNKGSIAFHADDGKLFVGSGVGDDFGPRCHKGDVMGCGIIFPRDYICNFESDDSREMTPSPSEDPYHDGSPSESEDEEWWKEKDSVENGAIVQVFFTRNGKTIGQKAVPIPKGGFYPTVGMLSCHEKVRVDLHPLTG